jgi:hypothetical protein
VEGPVRGTSGCGGDASEPRELGPGRRAAPDCRADAGRPDRDSIRPAFPRPPIINSSPLTDSGGANVRRNVTS